MNNSIAIVVIAYNRPDALKRLLSSLEGAFFEEKNIPLIISIDKSESNAVELVANNFKWTFGEKRVIVHAENLGLKKHVISCGDLVYEYEGIIMLEDDLFVSPYFYDYTRQAYNFYKHDKRISGISLYSYDFNEHALAPFTPIDDGYDNFFMQMPSSIGQFFSLPQWDGFKQFLQNPESSISEQDNLPERIIQYWPASSWKKHFYKYMLVHDTYFVYPRISFTTNFGDIGTHFSKVTNNYQVNILLGKRSFRFCHLSESLSIYDNQYELIPEIIKKLNPNLREINFTCDLYGTRNKSKVNTRYMISARECNKPLFRFGLEMSPQELNICFHIPGSYFSLAEVSDFQEFEGKKKFAQLLFNLKFDYESAWNEYLEEEIKIVRKVEYEKGITIMKNSATYKIGSTLLQPFRIFRKK